MRKSPLGLLLCALIVVSLVSATTMHFSGAQSSGTNVSGTLTSDTTWTSANSPYNLTGNVNVNSGVTLYIQPGVTVNFNNYVLNNYGTLNAQGTLNDLINLNLSDNGNEPGVDPAIDFEMSSTSWNQQTSTGSIIEYAVINSAWQPATILIDSVSPKIYLDTINYCGPHSGGGPLIDVEGTNANPIIANNTVAGDIYAQGGLICNNTINTAALSNGDSALGIWGNVTVLGNLLCGGYYGIYASGNDGDNVLVQNNLIVNNTYGVGVGLANGFSLLMQNNTVSDNTYGVYLSSQSSPESANLTIQSNNIFNNRIFNFQITLTSDFNATSNWWGTTNTTAISQAIYDFKYDFNLGTVNFLPFLNAPNPMAPAYTSNCKAPSPPEANVPPGYTPVSGIIGSDITWTSPNSPYFLTGNILVNNSITLTIQPGVTVYFNGFYIKVNGTLDAQGTSDDKIILNNPSTSSSSNSPSIIEFGGNSTNWNPQTSTGSIIEYATITTQLPIIIDSSSPKIDLSTINSTAFQTGGYHGMASYPSSILVQGTNPTPIIANNTIFGAIFANGGLICNNTITRSSLSGLGYIYNYGLNLQGNVTATGNKLYSLDQGITVEDGSNTVTLIQSNLAFNNTIGLSMASYSDNSKIIVQNNTFSDNNYGIVCTPVSSGSPNLSLGRLNGPIPGNVTIIYNNLFNNIIHNLDTTYSSDFNAFLNWWGTTNATTIGQFIYDYKYDFNLGIISFTPFLTAANPNAPAYTSTKPAPSPPTAPQAPAGYTSVGGVINSDTIWTAANSPYCFTGNVLVNNGVTLTIQPGVTVNFNSFYLRVNGTLTAQGTNGKKITFNIPSQPSSAVNQAIGMFPAIQFESCSSSWNPQTGSGSIIENAVVNSNWFYTGDSGVYRTIEADGVSPKIAFNSISLGFGNSYYNTFAIAIYIQGSNSSPVIANNTITGEVHADGGQICNNTVTTLNQNYPAISVQGNTTVTGNTVYNSGTAIYAVDYQLDLANDTTAIKSNLIYNNTYGLELTLDPSYNVWTLYQNGIFTVTYPTNPSLSNYTMVVENNTIILNSYGICLSKQYNSTSFTNLILTYNNIYDNRFCNLQTTYATSFNFAYNWWGTNNSAAIAQTIIDANNATNPNTITYLPFLNYSNAAAPIFFSTSQTTQPTPTPTVTATTNPAPTATPTSNSHTTTTPTTTPTLTNPAQTQYILIVIVAVFLVVVVASVFAFTYTRRNKLRRFASDLPSNV